MQAILLALFFIAGNIALFSGDTDDMELAIAVDSAIAIWLLVVIGKAVGASYEKRNEKNLAERKEIVVKEIRDKISHKTEIRHAIDKHLKAIDGQLSLISLISSCMGTSSQELGNHLFINKKEEAFENAKIFILDKLAAEKSSFPQSINEVADYTKTLEQEISELKTDLSSVGISDDEQLSVMIKEHCPDLHKSINRKRIKLIATIVIPIIIIITLVCTINFIKNAPYRELHSMIEEQSLTAEMIEWSNKNEDSYYDLIHSEKGYKFLATELTELHRKNDIKKQCGYCLSNQIALMV